ncbi:MAG: autotransporter outer membrane beta-barrel domain-containing protein [Succinivibrio sp.]|nr:autotransporter outer membrane beta-barrel domain-containing protein [Succinivibrio sp.]MDY6262409.1 autotransporter outer membrane beta-barrel domain-containing protein [Succinivibrio sp.]
MKQTRGAINLLIASYKGVLKNALIASMTTVALSGVANAKTIDLSDDSYFTSASVDITDDRDGSDTLVTITDSSFNDTRTVGEIYNSNGKMSFDKGGKINAQSVALVGGTFDATGTSITANILNISDKYPRYAPAIFEDLTVTDQVNASKGSFKAKNLVLDQGSRSSIDQIASDNLTIGSAMTVSTNPEGTIANIGNADFNNLVVTSSGSGYPTTVCISNLGGSSSPSANVITGNIAIGANSALVIGMPQSEYGYNYALPAARVAALGGPTSSTPKFKSILYVYDNLGVSSNVGITVDGTTSNPSVTAGVIRIGENSAIALSSDVTQRALKTGDDKAAIQFDGKLTYTDSSKILLNSTRLRDGSVLHLFKGTVVKNEAGDNAADLAVESVNGNFRTTIRNGEWTGYTRTDPVSGNNSSSTTTTNNGNQGSSGAGTGSSGTSTNGGNNTSNGTSTLHQTFTRGNFYNQGSSIYETMQDAIHDLTSVGKAGADFLATVAGETFTGGKEAEQAARLGQLGGAYQAAFTVGSITDNIVSSRNGVGSSTGSLIVSNNNNGFGIWLSPMVKVANSNGFESDGLSYGNKVRLADFAIGADYTFTNGSRTGAYFHTGNGKSTGKGLATHTDGELKYYGAGLYGKFVYNKFSLVGDFSYNKITDDVDTDLGLLSYTKASANIDTHMVKAGLVGQYNFDVKSVSVIPHAGVRYTTMYSENYCIKANDNYIAKVKNDRLSLVSVPVGVTVEKTFAFGSDWKVKPALDLGLTFNSGDTDATYKTTFIGAKPASLKAEVVDKVVYNAGAGLKFSHKKNADIETGVAYSGSDNTNDVSFYLTGSYQF